MKKFRLHLQLFIILILAFGVLSPFMVPEPVYALEPPGKIIDKEWLDPDEVRVNQHTKIKRVGTEIIDGQIYTQYEAEISTLAQTMPDLVTKITVEWRYGKADDGVPYWETGNNIFWARVTGTRVSVEYENILAAWDPNVYVGDIQLELKKGPTLTKDYFGNENYKRPNCIEWVYEAPKSLWQKLFGGKPFQVTRIVRQIEGLLQEYYIIESHPQGNFRVENSYDAEEGFIWHEDVSAYDSKGIPLEVMGGRSGKTIDAREFGRPELTYPIIVDPTTDPLRTSSSNDATLQKSSAVSYATSRDASSGTVMNMEQAPVGQWYSAAGGWVINRFAAVWYTGGVLPDNAIIHTVGVYLTCYSKSADTSFSIVAQNGGSRPSIPTTGSDYNRNYYSGNGGSISSGDLHAGYQTSFTLNSQGISWISKTGYTRLMLRSNEDINNSEPAYGVSEFVNIYQREMGSGYAPTLVIYYTTPVFKPVISTWSAQDITSTSAKLRGYLSDDGGVDCTVKFEYGTTDVYGSYTSPSGGHRDPYSWSTVVYGLDPGTLYHYTAKASNSEGSSIDDDETFLTKPKKPESFVVTGGEGQNELTWTKGTGSEKTKIRRSTSGFPLDWTEGTGVYFDTGTSHTDTAVVNGTTYYYSAWGFTDEGVLEQYSPDYAKDEGTPETTGPPSMRTDDATEVTQTTATFRGYLISMEGADTVDVYFHYKEEGGEFSQVAADEGTLSTPGSFTKAISGLGANTTYIVKAKGVGFEAEIGWGNETTFKTGEACAPTMETIQTSTSYSDQATLYGKVLEDGGAVVTAWFDWGKTETCGTPTDSTTGLATDDSVPPVILTGLDPDTTYYYKVVGHNEAGDNDGAVLNFTTTAPTDPEVTTKSAVDVGSTSATLRGILDGDGGVECEARFQWSLNVTLSENVTASSWVEGYRTGHPIEKYITGLDPGETWYFRVQAQHGWSGVINGTILNLDTVFTAPTNFMVLPQTSTSIALSWESQADETLIRGKVGSYPSDRLDGSHVYKGPGDSVTWGNLEPGTTYFFRAWSWREGGEYSGTYAEDAATTLSGVRPEEVDTPLDTINTTAPRVPSWWFQEPTSEHIQSWPAVDFIDSIAEGMGMPIGTMWMIIAGLGSILLGAAAAIILPIPWVVVGTGGIFIGILSVVGVLAGWILIMYIFIGIAILYLIGRSA